MKRVKKKTFAKLGRTVTNLHDTETIIFLKYEFRNNVNTAEFLSEDVNMYVSILLFLQLVILELYTLNNNATDALDDVHFKIHLHLLRALNFCKLKSFINKITV